MDSSEHIACLCLIAILAHWFPSTYTYHICSTSPIVFIRRYPLSDGYRPVLLSYDPVVLLSYCPAFLLYLCPAVLLFSGPPILPSLYFALQLSCCSATLLYCFSAVLLSCCPAVLLSCCPAVLLLCCPPVLLFCSFAILSVNGKGSQLGCFIGSSLWHMDYKLTFLEVVDSRTVIIFSYLCKKKKMLKGKEKEKLLL